MSEDSNVKNDYDYSRDTYYELIEKGKESLEMMVEVARESEHPRAYEVLSGMIKNISDVNDKLMDLNKKQKDINKSEDVKQVENQQNNYFLGSTADIQKLLQEDDAIDVEPERIVSRES
jgi:ABC-type proline/glycine betaine transport system substrate-binding protein